ncbi:hypothetical protein MTO96_013295 [Rhipicephalus appendiculatus]
MRYTIADRCGGRTSAKKSADCRRVRAQDALFRGARSRREMNKSSANRALMRTALLGPERGGVPPPGLLVPGHVINQAFFRKPRLSAASRAARRGR